MGICGIDVDIVADHNKNNCVGNTEFMHLNSVKYLTSFEVWDRKIFVWRAIWPFPNDSNQKIWETPTPSHERTKGGVGSMGRNGIGPKFDWIAQGCSNLSLEGQSAAEFSSDQTHLPVLF